MSLDINQAIKAIQINLKLINELEDDKKLEGLKELGEIISNRKDQLVPLGYDQVIFKELVRIVQFDKDQVLIRALELLRQNYFSEEKFADELAEVIIYRIARATDIETCRECLTSLSFLVDHMGDNVAKHSKQILKLADVNDISALNPLIAEILKKLETKLPKRRNI